MPHEFKLPDLGEGITEGEIVRWLVKEGDRVDAHQGVVEVETDKAIVEVPSPKKGVVARLNRKEGDTVEVGEVIFTLTVEGEEKKLEQRPASLSVVGTMPETEEVLATPGVRHLAKKLGVDLNGVAGTGPGGRITEEDVRDAAMAQGAAASPGGDRDRYGPVERIKLKGVRKSITRRLIRSQKVSAFVTAMDEADVTGLWNLKNREKEAAAKLGAHLTFMPFFIKAVQHALKAHPLLNGSVDDEGEEIVVKKYYNIGIAVDTDEGLMVPVVKEVDRKSIVELAAELGELSRKARERKITLDELKGSTFTITNYGTFGGLFATPILNHPDVGILGTGRIRDKPWIHEGEIKIRKILPISLTFDHRVVDGSEASLFMSRIINYLEDPGKLFIESA
ncbi:MAG TPA: 2-oxo acid dehydrogenase subunit E2 [Deltaproteobacteria bacterium]|nr:2-oxo acid dehydrogenase subunit E2 [Deltaproteobacteria bacterium]